MPKALQRAARSRIYCSHGFCTSNNLDKVDGVKLLPFPKPCDVYISSLHDASIKHSGKQCPQCSKCLRWIHLCNRYDKKLQRLFDISKQTYICTEHFANKFGPTEMDPDPYPATVGEGETRKTARRAPKDRSMLQPFLIQTSFAETEHPLAKKRRESTSMLSLDELAEQNIKSELAATTPETTEAQYQSMLLQRTEEPPATKRRGSATMLLLEEPAENIIIKSELTATSAEATTAQCQYMLLQRTEEPPAEKHRESTTMLLLEEPAEHIKIKSEFAATTSQATTEQYQSMAMDHGYSVPVDFCIKSPEDDTLSVLKSLYHSIVDTNLITKFDNEYLSVFFLRGPIVEKACVVNRDFKLEIYALGRLVKDSNEIFQKYPKTWDMKNDFLAFLKELSENWFVCKTSLESQDLQKLKDRSSKADSYEFDTITGGIRSLNCALLTARELCLHCRKMMRHIRYKIRRPAPVSCRKISLMTREEAQKKLRMSMIQLSNEKKKNARRTKMITKLIRGGMLLTSDDNNDLLSS